MQHRVVVLFPIFLAKILANPLLQPSGHCIPTVLLWLDAPPFYLMHNVILRCEEAVENTLPPPCGAASGVLCIKAGITAARSHSVDPVSTM